MNNNVILFICFFWLFMFGQIGLYAIDKYKSFLIENREWFTYHQPKNLIDLNEDFIFQKVFILLIQGYSLIGMFYNLYKYGKK